MERSPTFSLRDLFWALTRASVMWRRLPPRRVFFKQVYFSGLQALPLVLLVGAATAGILVGQLRNFGQSPKDSVDVLLTITLGELAPLLTAFLVTARSAPAMASELATMQANGEVRLLMRLGISPLEYLIVPRVTAMVAGVLLLSLYFAFAAALAGAALASGVHMFNALTVVAQSISIMQVVTCLMKSVLFGMAIALVGCHTGLAARGSYTEVPIAASKAVVRSLACIIVIDAVMVLLL